MVDYPHRLKGNVKACRLFTRQYIDWWKSRVQEKKWEWAIICIWDSAVNTPPANDQKVNKVKVDRLRFLTCFSIRSLTRFSITMEAFIKEFLRGANLDHLIGPVLQLNVQSVVDFLNMSEERLQLTGATGLEVSRILTAIAERRQAGFYFTTFRSVNDATLMAQQRYATNGVHSPMRLLCFARPTAGPHWAEARSTGSSAIWFLATRVSCRSIGPPECETWR